MKKKAFTLIELLATVIILGIVALIATPIMLDVIDAARSKANRESIYGIIKAGEYYYAEALLDDSKKENIENINNVYDLITVTGDKPENGELYVNKKGLVALSVKIDNKCYVKEFYDELEEKENDEDCNIGYTGVDEISPTVSFKIEKKPNEAGWYNTNPYVKITVNDSESGINNYRWCTGYDCDAEKSNNIETNLGKIIEILDNKETQVCVIAYDKAANNSGKVCSEVLKVDTIKPEFSGIMGDTTIPLNGEIDILTGVSASDATSGIKEDFKIYNEKGEEITSLDTSKAGIYKVKYVVYDKAENKNETTLIITVSATAPTVSYDKQQEQ